MRIIRQLNKVILIFGAVHINVPDYLHPLAFGAQPAKAGCVAKVPQAWELGPSTRWDYLFRFIASLISLINSSEAGAASFAPLY